MLKQKTIVTLLAAAITTLSGCSTLTTNTQPSKFDKKVTAVTTDYSNALMCLGDLVDAKKTPTLTVYVQDIDDDTVPKRFSSRRLSKGGAWWFHTAVSKMQTDRVVSVLQRPDNAVRAKPYYVELSGAWTQDDVEVGVNEKGVGFSNLGTGILDRFGWFNRDEVSVIAGDFVSTIQGRVKHSSAISLAISGNGHDYQLRIDDGSRRFDLGLTNEVNEGPQFAQRRIAEAAALVHIAMALDIDYQSCISAETDQTNTQAAAIKRYMSGSMADRHALVQQALSNAGYEPGPADGKWGTQSAEALKKFTKQHNLIVTGQHDAQLYALLVQQKSTVPLKNA